MDGTVALLAAEGEVGAALAINMPSFRSSAAGDVHVAQNIDFLIRTRRAAHY